MSCARAAAGGRELKCVDAALAAWLQLAAAAPPPPTRLAERLAAQHDGLLLPLPQREQVVGPAAHTGQLVAGVVEGQGAAHAGAASYDLSLCATGSDAARPGAQPWSLLCGEGHFVTRAPAHLYARSVPFMSTRRSLRSGYEYT